MHIFSKPYTKTVAVLLLLGSAKTFTLPKRQPLSGNITAQQLLQIAPDSGSCSGAQYPSECATADQAAPFINDAFAKYGINTMAEKAAVISLMMSETGDLKANINHNGVGQGSKLERFLFATMASLPSLFVYQMLPPHRGSSGIKPDLINPSLANSTEHANVQLQRRIRKHFSPTPGSSV
jgi:hypothetical protein